MTRRIRRIGGDSSGAVAPTVALSLFALIGAGGIAFDYARMATLDTELQSAADQAALAAASQLDGTTGACARAAAAARALITNTTLLANDGSPIGIGVASESACDATGSIRFYQSYNQATDTPGAAATTDAEAKVVQVAINGRAVNFALTPIVGALSSGTFGAEAIASLGHAICKTPPIMMCNPDEPIGNANVNYPFDANALKGVGVLLVGDGSYEPGNWGFLQNNGSGASVLLKNLAYNTPPGDCQPQTGVDTQTGVVASVMDGLNTRFDVDANGNSCPGGNALCSPSLNVRKDLARGTTCGITGQGWEENQASSADYESKRYRPASATAYPTSGPTTTPEIMGHPRDLCHAYSGTSWSCGGTANRRIGTGDWDINAYWRSNFGANYANEVSVATYGSQPKGYPTRYQVYLWEMDNYTTKLNPKAGSGGKTAYSKPVAATCLATNTAPYGIEPSTSVADRRRLSIAVLNCKALNIGGHENDQPVLKWVDVFMVEPSFGRSKCTSGPGCNTKYTDKTDIYVEIIGETQSGSAGATAGQVVRRDVPYLIK